jgi:uncharacterized membrane protein YqiK
LAELLIVKEEEALVVTVVDLGNGDGAAYGESVVVLGSCAMVKLPVAVLATG